MAPINVNERQPFAKQFAINVTPPESILATSLQPVLLQLWFLLWFLLSLILQILLKIELGVVHGLYLLKRVG